MTRQAIVTKYFSPSNVRGSRVKAKCNAGSITLHWDHALNADRNHFEAAMMLVGKLGWGDYGTWHQGSLPNESGYCFVCVEKEIT